MIDLHCHILPGLDDGPASLEESLAMAGRAVEGGNATVVATPHIREDYPFELERIAADVAGLTREVEHMELPLRIVPGGEVGLTRLVELSEEELGRITLGDGQYVLVESPYGHATELLEQALFDLQLRGFRPVLAHPERSPAFLSNPRRLASLVERDVLCSVTADSALGRFGRTVKGFCRRLLADGLAHNVASDAHDSERRAPLDRAALAELERALPGGAEELDWLVDRVPAALLRGDEVPPRPEGPSGAGGRAVRRLRRLMSR